VFEIFSCGHDDPCDFSKSRIYTAPILRPSGANERGNIQSFYPNWPRHYHAWRLPGEGGIYDFMQMNGLLYSATTLGHLEIYI